VHERRGCSVRPAVKNCHHHSHIEQFNACWRWCLFSNPKSHYLSSRGYTWHACHEHWDLYAYLVVRVWSSATHVANVSEPPLSKSVDCGREIVTEQVERSSGTCMSIVQRCLGHLVSHVTLWRTIQPCTATMALSNASASSGRLTVQLNNLLGDHPRRCLVMTAVHGWSSKDDTRSPG
jgi:hypothetical protein